MINKKHDLNEGYNLIEDEIMRDEILIYCFSFLNLPIARFMPDVANGYLEISDIASTFFCSNEHDIWRLIAEKEIMDVLSLYSWYKGMIRILSQFIATIGMAVTK